MAATGAAAAAAGGAVEVAKIPLGGNGLFDGRAGTSGAAVSWETAGTRAAAAFAARSRSRRVGGGGRDGDRERDVDDEAAPPRARLRFGARELADEDDEEESLRLCLSARRRAAEAGGLAPLDGEPEEDDEDDVSPDSYRREIFA